MAAILKDPRVRVLNENGIPYVGAKLYVYDTGTTTLQAIFTDSALSVAASNPLESDSEGYFDLTYLTAGTYKVRIEQSDGTLIVEADNQDTGVPLGSGVLAIANGGTGGATAAAARTALDVPANSEVTTLTAAVAARLLKSGGELTGDTDNSGTGFFAIPSGTTAQRAAPSNGTGLRYNSDTGQLEAYINAVWVEMIALPTGYIDGYILSNNSGTPTTHVDIAIGAARNVQSSNSDTVNIRLATALTKDLSSTWVAGDNNGMLDGGAVGNNTWYHIFSILNPTSGVVDILASSSIDSPTLPSGYTRSRRIGAVLTDGSGNIIGFTQTGDMFIWDNPTLDVDVGTVGTTAITPAISTPLGVKTNAWINIYGIDGGNQIAHISSPDADDEAPSSTAGPLGVMFIKSTDAMMNMHVLTSTSSTIRIRGSGGIATFRLATLGYEDPRGRNE